MPRETPERMCHYRGRASKDKEHWSKSRDYGGFSEKKISHRSRYDKIRHRSRSPKRTCRRRSSRSRSRSVSHSRRHWRGRSSSRSSSRSRSRSKSRYSRRHRNRSQSKGSQSRGRSRSRSRSRSVTPRKEHYREGSISRRNYQELPKAKELRVKTEPLDEDQFKESNSEDYQAFAGYFKTENDDEDPIDKEKIHKQIEEKLRLALAKEGKVYPPPKPEASHPVFANDGSFLEVFKKMQEQAKQAQQSDNSKSISKPLCKRRGGKILKTGIVSKPKVETSTKETDPKDFWSIYLQEVKKYKSASCDIDSKTRPLVK